MLGYAVWDWQKFEHKPCLKVGEKSLKFNFMSNKITPSPKFSQPWSSKTAAVHFFKKSFKNFEFEKNSNPIEGFTSEGSKN